MLSVVLVTASTIAKPKPQAPPEQPKARKIPVRISGSPRATVKATAVHVRTERPKTLVRSAVQKSAPAKSWKQAVAPVLSGAKPTVLRGHNDQRDQRATHIIKSHHITKFASPSGVTHRTEHIPVRQAPAQKSKQHTTTHSIYNIHDVPPAPSVTHTSRPQTKHAPNIFEEALRTAESHKKTHPSRKSRRSRKQIGALVASFLILALFFTYQNAPRIALRNAQSQIGFHASVPRYTPAGFGRASAIQYQKGLVVLNFRSASDDRQYAITQASTSLDNESLVEKYFKPQNKQYQATTVKGQPVYIYDDSRATWISHGVWYTIDGNARLNKDQLTNIIASI